MTEAATPLKVRDLVEGNVDRIRENTSLVPVSQKTGGLAFQSMDQMIDAAKMLAASGPAVPPWMRGNPGGCWAILVQASQWGFDPISVARQSYEVNGMVAYMSQLIHALIERRATKRLRFTYHGEGQERACQCDGFLPGETDVLSLITPPVRQISPKKSPLWNTDPDQQLSYYAARSWCRRYAPDVLLGVYDRDEIEQIGPDHARDVTPKAELSDDLHERLLAAQEQNGSHPEGWAEGGVEAGLSEQEHKVLTGGGQEASEEAAERENEAAEARSTGPAKKRASEPRTPEERRFKVKGAPRKAKATAKPAKSAKPEPETAEPPRTATLTKPLTKEVVKAAADRAERSAAAKAPPLPKTPDQYEEHVAGWLPGYDTEEKIEERWRTEMRLRNECNLTSERRAPIRALVDQRINEIRR